MTTPRNIWPSDAAPVRPPALTPQLVTERILLSALHDQDAAALADDARKRAEFLAEAGLRFGASLDQELTYAAIAGIALPGVGGWCIVDIVETGGSLRRLAVVHPDADKRDAARALAARWIPDVDAPIGVPLVRQAENAIVDDASGVLSAALEHDADLARFLEELGAGPMLVVPIRLYDQLLGAITFVNRAGAPAFTPDDIVLANALATRCAQALESARLYAAARTAWAEADAARLEAEAANASKALFLSTMSHELRTPLNAIGGYAQMIQMGIRGPVTPEQQADLVSIQRGQAHLLGLVDAVLDYQHLAQGKVSYRITDVTLCEMVSEVVSLVAPQMAEQKLDFRTEEGDPALRVRADAGKLRQIVLNLVGNAMKFTRAGGTITVACQTVADGDANTNGAPVYAVRVTDTGSGIVQGKWEAIFEPFVQLKDRNQVSGRSGVGLGLAISRDLARGMGGDLVLERSSDAGSTFLLTLPGVQP